MIWLIYSFAFIIIAAVCNAVMDKCSFHFYRSIFSDLDPQFWNPEVSWQNKYVDGDSTKGRIKWFLGFNKPVQITDSFHLFKTIMIFCLCASIVFSLICDLDFTPLEYVALYGTYGVTWNLTFSLFFKKIFQKT